MIAIEIGILLRSQRSALAYRVLAATGFDDVSERLLIDSFRYHWVVECVVEGYLRIVWSF
jgi:hypothetical protein